MPLPHSMLKSYVAWGLRRVAVCAEIGSLNQPKFANSELEGRHVRPFKMGNHQAQEGRH